MSSVLKLLILEDRSEDVELVLYELRHAGFHPRWWHAENEEQYEQYLMANEVDVILADYVLPQFDALRALQMVKERNLDVPFIVVTGTASEDVVVQCMNQGAADYLLKDRLTRLGQAITHALEERKLRVDKRRTEDALQESDERFKRLAENVQDIIYRIRFSPDFAMEYISPAAKDITGYTPQEYYTDPSLWLNVLREKDAISLCEKILNSQNASTRLTQIWCRDGLLRWLETRDTVVLDANGQLIAVEGVARDVTEREQTAETLRHNDAKMRALLDGIPDIMFLVRGDGTILECKFPGNSTQTAEKLIDCNLSELSELGLVPVDAVRAAKDVLRRALETHQAQALAVEFETPPKGRRYFDLRASASGENEVVLIVREVTESRRAHETLVRAELMNAEIGRERELVQLKENFISMISHEFRTPLAVIMSSIETLEYYSDRMTPERRLEKLHKVKAQTEYMSELMNQVLFISRAKAGKLRFEPRQMNLITFCQDMIEHTKLRSGYKQHVMTFHHEGDLDKVWIDEKLLQHILINLLENAAKYSPAGSEIKFEATEQGDYVSFTVSDRGIGIPPDDQVHLFEAFHRARNTDGIGGTGLGLSIVKNSVDVHQGIITCESQPDVGTTFTVLLPLRLEKSLLPKGGENVDDD